MPTELNHGQIEESILKFVESELSAAGSQPIASNDDLLSSGVLDSLAIVLLTEYISSSFALEIDVDDVTPENFESVATITNLIASRTSQ